MNTQQPRTREALLEAISGGMTPDWLFFWGHTPPKSGGVSKSCLSQWWDGHPFSCEGATYSSAEHFMMAEKARLFGDSPALERILNARTPAEAKKLGRLVAGFEEDTWLANRWGIVVRGSFAKFHAHPELSEYLLATGEKVLVEASPYDRVWGIGMGADDPGAGDPARWNGLNLLGFALMEARRMLRSGDQANVL